MDLNEAAVRILPIYKRYEARFATRLPRLSQISILVWLSVFGFGFWHRMTGTPIPFWESVIMAWLFILAATMYLISGVVGLFYPRRKSPEAEMRERLSLDRAYAQELRSHSAEARGHFLKYIQHYWTVVETRAKSWAAIALTVGGFATTVPEWVGQPKGSYSFLIVMAAIAYVGLIAEQTAIAQSKRFGELLETEAETDVPELEVALIAQ